MGICGFIGDLGEYWNALREHRRDVDSERRARRAKRVAKFAANLPEVRELAALYGIEVRISNDDHHVQMRCGEYIASYFPSSQKFFFQKPLRPTVGHIAPEDALLMFLRQARSVAAADPDVYAAWWRLGVDGRPPPEVTRVGAYLMPQLREDVLDLASLRPTVLDRVDPHEFEHLIATLLVRRGFRATVTAASGDGGRDIIAVQEEDGRETMIFVECKRYLAKPVGIDIVQRAVGVSHIHRADHSYIVATARFTEPAREEAQLVQEELTLVDRETLHQWLAEAARSPVGDGSSPWSRWLR